MEHFYTLQGEGYFSGQAAYFVRLGGCDVGCVWCDVKESWEADAHPAFSVSEIVKWATDAGAARVVITGGEPTLYDLSPLCNAFAAQHIHTHIETSGAHAIRGHLDWVTLSPKKFKAPLKESLLKADELKIVVYHPSDFKWAEEQAQNVNENCYLYLQPEWSKHAQLLPQIIEYVKQNPKWSISLQTHKYMNIP